MHEHGLVLDPENPIMHWSLGYTYALLGRRADARERAQWMQSRVPQMPYTTQLVALLDGLDGRVADARAVLASVENMAFDGHITFHLSESFAVSYDAESALRLVTQAVDRGFYPNDYIAVHCPFLATLRGTAEFDAIVARAAKRVVEFQAQARG